MDYSPRTLEHYSSAHYREGHLVASLKRALPELNI